VEGASSEVVERRCVRAEVVAAKAASGDGRSGRSARWCSVDRGLNGGLLFGDTWSCGLRMVSLKEEGGDAVAGSLGKEQ
jgi:hypothetical protein